MKRLTLLLFSLPFVLLAQNYRLLDQHKIFDNASSFYITASGYIYVTDAGSSEIKMIDSLGQLINEFGGFGWKEGNFDEPSDVFADPLTIYVADKNNNRIQRFDKNLNYVSSIYTRESEIDQMRFGYPLSCATSNQGDLYILDSENNRIVKFDVFGNFLQTIGGFDAGNFALRNPGKLALSSDSKVFVSDGSDVIIFDQFGNGIAKIGTSVTIKSIRILFDKLTINSSDKIFTSNLKSGEKNVFEIKLTDIDKIPEMVSTILFNSKLYVLTQKSILIFVKD